MTLGSLVSFLEFHVYKTPLLKLVPFLSTGVARTDETNTRKVPFSCKEIMTNIFFFSVLFYYMTKLSRSFLQELVPACIFFATDIETKTMESSKRLCLTKVVKP